ncbi:MAG TPA: efflux RND transporter permease subunit, partial [Methylomirabilota bacterium]
IGLAVMATTFSLVVIFLPVSFMSSVSGRFLYQFGVTAAVSVLVSLLVSFTLTPMMSARMIRAGATGGAHGHAEAASRRGFYAWLDRGYAFSLRQSMRYRWVVVAISFATIVATWPIYGWVKQEYTPTDVDESEFEATINGPEGISMPAMDEAVQAIADEIRAVPGVRHVLITAGGGFLGRISQGSIYVRTAPHDDRTFGLARLWRETLQGHPLGAFRGNYNQREVMQQVRLRMRKFRDFRILVRNIPGFNIGGGSFDIDFVLRGPDLEALSRYAEELRTRAIALGGIADPDTTLRLDRPELRVRIDRERAGDLRVDTEQTATALRLMVGGDTEVSRYRDPGINEDYYVQLRLSEKDRGDLGTISRLFVSRQGGDTGPGSLVRLDNLVQIASGFTASRIDRSDRQREVRLRAVVLPGFGQADRIAALRGAVAEMRLPAGYSTAISGRARELERTFTEFLWVFLLSVVFMYMILAAQFESLIHPLTILLSLPLSVPFALLSLWYTGNTLNLYSALGILVLFGVVKKNAILQIDHMNSLRAEGLSREDAIMVGNRDRLRPILMTTLALVAGMLPLWAGTGPGAEERRAIAVVVVGGQTLSLLLTLLVTPVAYSIFEDLARALGRVPEFSRRGSVLRFRRWRRGAAERS